MDGDGFCFGCEMVGDDRGVEGKGVESLMVKKVRISVL